MDIEADGCVPEWAGSGRCKVHACAREHGVQFCGFCKEFPCEKLKYYSFWEFDTKENYGKAIKVFFDNYNKELQKLLIAPFDINLGYSV